MSTEQEDCIQRETEITGQDYILEFALPLNQWLATTDQTSSSFVTIGKANKRATVAIVLPLRYFTSFEFFDHTPSVHIEIHAADLHVLR